jgi:hypothetical protein
VPEGVTVHGPRGALECGGRLLRLPDRGRLLVATDLQGNLRDCERMLALFDGAGDQALLVFTGDLVHGPDDPTVAHWPEHLGTPYRDESPAVVDAFRAAQARAPGRVFCLLGNHDHAHVGGPATCKFHPDEREALEARLDDRGREQLRATLAAFPLVAVAPCGVALSHAAPAAALESLEHLARLRLDGYQHMNYLGFLDVPVVGELLWARGATAAQAASFLRAVGAQVAVFGHDVVAEGFCRAGPQQVRVSTSFGLLERDKVYVELDLSRRYTSADDLREGVELKRLWR